MPAGLEKSFKEGEVIFQEGDDGQEIHILLRGSIGIYKEGKRIAVVDQPGTVLGEISVILNEKRSATLKAERPTTVCIIKVTLEELVIVFPEFSGKMLKTLASRLRDTTRDLSQTMLQIADTELKRIEHASSLEDLMNGDRSKTAQGRLSSHPHPAGGPLLK